MKLCTETQATYQRCYGAPQLLGRSDAEIVYKVHGQLTKVNKAGIKSALRQYAQPPATKRGLAYQIIKNDTRPPQSVKLAQVKGLCAKGVVVEMQPRLDIFMGDQCLLLQ